MENGVNVNMDLIGSEGMVQGEVAARFLRHGRLDPGAMRPFVDEKTGRSYMTVYKGSGDPSKPSSYETQQIQTNATLRRDEWKQLDEAILRTSRQRLVGVQDLIDNNLILPLGNALGTTVLEWHSVSDSMNAVMSMDGVTRSPGDRPNFATNYMPLPIIHVDFEINARVLEASRRLGNPLDTTSIEHATRRINEQLEDLLFTATSYTFGGGTMYSYLNETNRNTVTLSTDWDASAKTAAQILTDVRNMKQQSVNARHYGPWVLYVPTAYEVVLDDDYSTSTAETTTIRERILKIAGISGIKVVDRLTADNVILAQMTSDVVRLVRGMGIQVVEWQTEGKFVTKYKVMTIQLPQIRADQGGRSGIVHLS